MKITLEDPLNRPLAYMIKAKISEFLQKQDVVTGFHCDIPLLSKKEDKPLFQED